MALLTSMKKHQRWLASGIMATVAFLLGYWGFWTLSKTPSMSLTVSDILYRVLQLFSLSGGDVSSPLPWQLDWARFLAPLVAAYTVILAILAIFRNQIQRLKLLTTKDHVIICGMGAMGMLLATQIHASGCKKKIVVIESDPANANLPICRRLGMVVLVGNAADVGILQQARIHHASHLFAFCGTDERNSDIAVAAEDAVADRTKGMLTCIVNILDTPLCRLLREKELNVRGSSSFMVDYLNLYETGARVVLEAHPILPAKKTHPPHVMVAGLGRLGDEIVMRIIGNWRHDPSDGKIRITVVDEQAQAWKQARLKRDPWIMKYCDIETNPATAGGDDYDAETAFSDAALSDVETAYVCQDNPVDSVTMAITLHRHLRVQKPRIPIVVPMHGDSGLTRLLSGNGDDDYGNITAFRYAAKCLTADLLEQDMYSVIARAIHEDYVRNRKLAGETVVDNPSIVPWTDLNPEMRQANCDQAKELSKRLKDHDYVITRLTDWEAEYRPFPPDVEENMSEMEHDRWVKDKEAQGFTYARAPKTDRTHPCLVPWAKLPEEEKEKDREAVRAAPRILAEVGYQVVKELG